MLECKEILSVLNYVIDKKMMAKGKSGNSIRAPVRFGARFRPIFNVLSFVLEVKEISFSLSRKYG